MASRKKSKDVSVSEGQALTEHLASQVSAKIRGKTKSPKAIIEKAVKHQIQRVKAQTKPKPIEPKITARCLSGHTWIMTSEQIKEAQVDGMAMCPECGNVATVEKVSVKMK